MNDTCSVGFEYIVEKVHEESLQLDSALVRSMQTVSGMPGEVLPYQIRSEWSVTCLILFCFLVFSHIVKNGKKYIIQHIRSLFQRKDRSSLFDEVQGTDNGYTMVFPLLTCICYGLFFYYYSVESFPALVYVTPHEALIGGYILLSIFYMLFKWGSYNFVNWVFFEKEQSKAWIQTYFDLLSAQCFLLLPIILFIIYFRPDVIISNILIAFTLISAKILLFYRGFRNFFNQSYGFLHFILYFCALEMVPLLLLVKGILYINQIVILNF